MKYEGVPVTREVYEQWKKQQRGGTGNNLSTNFPQAQQGFQATEPKNAHFSPEGGEGVENNPQPTHAEVAEVIEVDSVETVHGEFEVGQKVAIDQSVMSSAFQLGGLVLEKIFTDGRIHLKGVGNRPGRPWLVDHLRKL